MMALVDRAAQAGAAWAQACLDKGQISASATAADIDQLALSGAGAFADGCVQRAICSRARGYNIIMRNAPLAFLVAIDNAHIVPDTVMQDAWSIYHMRILRYLEGKTSRAGPAEVARRRS